MSLRKNMCLIFPWFLFLLFKMEDKDEDDNSLRNDEELDVGKPASASYSVGMQRLKSKKRSAHASSLCSEHGSAMHAAAAVSRNADAEDSAEREKSKAFASACTV